MTEKNSIGRWFSGVKISILSPFTRNHGNVQVVEKSEGEEAPVEEPPRVPKIGWTDRAKSIAGNTVIGVDEKMEPIRKSGHLERLFPIYQGEDMIAMIRFQSITKSLGDEVTKLETKRNSPTNSSEETTSADSDQSELFEMNLKKTKVALHVSTSALALSDIQSAFSHLIPKLPFIGEELNEIDQMFLFALRVCNPNAGDVLPEDIARIRSLLSKSETILSYTRDHLWMVEDAIKTLEKRLGDARDALDSLELGI
ncbi:unnamed protein product [Caenorhabditis sp. 36 PRJEB53466]|nr:unnamed protein product [Caenorhabditis sp. 36 PRJEB53466]